MKFRFLLLLTLSFATTLSAQPLTAEFFTENPDCAGGIYHTYRFEKGESTPVPKGFAPVYVSHFGRHGSRWHASAGNYEIPYELFKKASKDDMLTDFGKEIYPTVKRMAKESRGRLGELSVQGANEHRGIAERMYAAYPKLFKGSNVHVESRSTNVPRCILSMAAFNERLKELNPKIDIYRTTNDNWHKVLVPSKGRKYSLDEALAATKSGVDSVANIYADEILAKIFKPEYKSVIDADRKAYVKLVRALHYMCIIMQDTEGDDRMNDIFTGEQRMRFWERVNVQRYATFANSEEYGDGILYDGSILMKEIVRDADDFLANGGRAAFLRFGHDVTVISTLAAMQVEGKCARTSFRDPNLKEKWVDFRITPMASNIQFIFYRNKAGEVIVKMLHNEQECRLPIESNIAPYYRWDDLRKYMTGRVDEIKSLPYVKKMLADKKKKKSSKSERADR